MLYLKSKELKNSSNNTFKIKGVSLFSLIALGLFSIPTFAQDATDFSSISQIASIFFSLLFVIAIIFALAFIMRRFNVTQAGKGELKVVASLVAGTKERVIVVQVGQEQHMLGVTAHNINHLAHLTTPINIAESGNATGSANSFQQKLTQAMAQAINPKMKNTNKRDPACSPASSDTLSGASQ
jgi:flagellar protein FliO/FliZ